MSEAPPVSELQDALLHTLRGTILAEVRAGEDLTLRQMAVTLTIYLTDAPQTVRGMAKHLGVRKPAITRALDRLSELGLVRRKVEPKDRRSVIAERTPAGAAMLERLREALAAQEASG